MPDAAPGWRPSIASICLDHDQVFLRLHPLKDHDLGNVSARRLNKRMLVSEQPKDASRVNKDNVIHTIKEPLPDVL